MERGARAQDSVSPAARRVHTLPGPPGAAGHTLGELPLLPAEALGHGHGRGEIVRWLDRVPLSALVIAALVLGLAPLFPEPHLWEKLKMLFSGSLSRPIDIFDLIMHGGPTLLLLLKLVGMARKR